ncbi:Capsular polysaccharide synthesis protein [Seminavis robusta]|uniref:Capsular polysaccharide synthesis protein n=1 Tax=Seminavis robusta TaxID=568900 RepID=A0A9N8H572_9STRA|nr:Capsular polysaccharide synthesis protein [Seminavis robusta]|eukprot:Sro67_g037670.1 Capsular polysaccharide synthesis protein (433) ;mRNA; r:96844-98142
MLSSLNDRLLKDHRPSAERRFTRIHYLSILGIILSLSCRSLLPETFTIGAVVEILGTCSQSLASVSRAKQVTPVVHRPFDPVWDTPLSSQELFHGSTKIIWGYWNTYPEKFPFLCQKALASWQLRNPDWRVIMLNDDNFRQYVSVSDLPTTFDSLKVQHRSDLIRLAVLIRYGGAYVDASTLMYKGLDGIWNDIDNQHQKLLLTSLNMLPGPKLDMYNNGLLMTRAIGNPFLVEWQQRTIAYNHAPALTVPEMKQHPAFARVHKYWDDPTLGVLGGMIPYHSHLWMLNDMIWHNDMGLASKHIVHLPKIRWSFYYHSLPHFFDKLRIMTSEQAQDPRLDPDVVGWTPLSLFWAITRHIMHGFYLNEELARGVVENIHMLKFTSHDMPLVDVAVKLGFNNTVGRIIDSAYNLTRFPIQQATLVGATPPSRIQE